MEPAPSDDVSAADTSDDADVDGVAASVDGSAAGVVAVVSVACVVGLASLIAAGATVYTYDPEMGCPSLETTRHVTV